MAKICVILLCAVTLWARSTAGYTKGTGSAISTRMWDCCKPTCAWSAHAPASSVSQPVKACAAGDGNKYVDRDAQSGCTEGGTAFMCNNQAPFVENGQAYAFSSARVNDLAPKDMCCSCYKLTFTSSELAKSRKTLIVQVTNTGVEYTKNQFDLEFPAGGAGLWPKGCVRQFPGVPAAAWGGLYGGIKEKEECDKLPAVLRTGCRFRWDWFRNADNPNVNFERIPCPKALTDRSGCIRHDD